MSKHWNKNGLTLIEVIISLAIILIVTLSFLTLFTSTFSTIISMGSKTEANRVAQEIIDYHYENEPITGSLPVMPTNIPTQYTVTRTTPSTTNGLTEVVITVSYRNNTRSVTLTALIP